VHFTADYISPPWAIQIENNAPIKSPVLKNFVDSFLSFHNICPSCDIIVKHEVVVKGAKSFSATSDLVVELH
jgi:hypothetical protein